MEDTADMDIILYYARQRYYRHIQNAVLELMQRNGNEPILVFWKAYSVIMEEQVGEGMRELEAVSSSPDLLLAAPLLLIYAHKKCKSLDRDAVQQLEAKVRVERTTCGEKALYYAGVFLWLTGRHDKAREYADRQLKLAPGSAAGLILRGWIDLTCAKEVMAKKSIKYFEEALSGSSLQRPLSALLGKSHYYYQRHNFSHSLEQVNQAIAAHPHSLPALGEKLRPLLALGEWEHAVDTAHRCLSQDRECIEACQLLALEKLTQRGKEEEGGESVGELVRMMDHREPSNHQLYYQLSLPLARVAGGSRLVLQQTITLVERALSLFPHSPTYLTELGYQQLLSGDLRESMQTFRKAFSADETSVPALAGIIHCQVLEGKYREAEQQLEFLAEVQSSIGRQPSLLYLEALLSQRRGNCSSQHVVQLLKQAMELHLSGLRGEPLGNRFFELFNPDFQLKVVAVLLAYAPTEPAFSPSQADPILREAVSILDPLTRTAPGLTPALHLLARVKYLSGEIESSKSTLHHCLSESPSSASSYLLLAEIQLHADNPTSSLSSLEMALSRSFNVQNSPHYHLLLGRVRQRMGQFELAMQALESALSIARERRKGGRKEGGGGGGGGGGEVLFERGLGLSELATAYLELVTVLGRLGKQHEATKVMQDAINEFTNTSEQFRITIANADLALSRGDTKQALSLLETVTEDKPYFIQARETMAGIYLSHLKDHRKYIACFRELAEKLPGPPTALVLGDAHMNIQEPQEALSVYEAALKKTPNDGILARKVGTALVRTHNYAKAVSFYEAALRSHALPDLETDLADLYLRLGQFERAEKIITAALSHREDSQEVSSLKETVQLLLLLSRARDRAGQQKMACQALQQARDTQARVLKKVNVDDPESMSEQKRLASRIACELGRMYLETKDYTTGVRMYREALLHCADDKMARLSLAQLHLLMGEVSEAEQECQTILDTNQDNQEAAMLMADLLFRRGACEEAAAQYQHILGKKPDHFESLAALIDLNRRAGRLSESQVYLEEAESVSRNPTRTLGLIYCKGLTKLYEQSSSEALRLFNQVRRDGEWGERALIKMVEICLRSDVATVDGDIMVQGEGSGSNEEQMAVRTAEKLLKEAHPKTPASQQRVQQLECYVLLASKTRAAAEAALRQFMQMAMNVKDSVPVLLGVATAHIALSQIPKARNQLKRIAKTPWNAQDAEEMERSWLLLAEMYMQAGKHDVATELIQKVLRYNKSCSRGWEHLGYISEKEHAYQDASSHYEKAWRYSSCSNPATGYKLAFNYLKAKRYVEAIEVCHTVLAKDPNYPKIRRDILEKARQSIRV